MKAEERIAELEEQVAALLAEKTAWQTQEQELREQLGQALTHIAQLVARLHELEGQGKQDSTTAASPHRVMGGATRGGVRGRPVGNRVEASPAMKGITSHWQKEQMRS